jgi:hypothetical protein
VKDPPVFPQPALHNSKGHINVDQSKIMKSKQINKSHEMSFVQIPQEALKAENILSPSYPLKN